MERQIFSPDELVVGTEYKLAYRDKSPVYSVFLKNLSNVVSIFTLRYMDDDEYGENGGPKMVNTEQSVFFRNGQFTDDVREPLNIYEIIQSGSRKRKFGGKRRRTKRRNKRRTTKRRHSVRRR